MAKTTTVNFAESTSQSSSQTITIPNLKSVVNVTVNTGNVTYSLNGNQITINVSNGAYTRYTTSTSNKPQSQNQAGPYIPRGTYSSCSDVYAASYGQAASSISYNDGTWSGTLYKTSYSGAACWSDGGGADGSALVTYTGTVYSTSYTYYYAYTVTVEYIDNTAPTLVTKIGAQTLTNNQNILVADKNGITFTISPSDVDAGDTLQYSIDLRGINKVPYTNATKDVGINYTVPYNDLVLGNNLVTIRIKDSAGDVTTFNVTLRNKTPSTLSQKTVGDVLAAMGYSYTNTSSLQALKPSGYSGNLSMSDIINYLT